MNWDNMVLSQGDYWTAGGRGGWFVEFKMICHQDNNSLVQPKIASWREQDGAQMTESSVPDVCLFVYTSLCVHVRVCVR